MADVSYQLQIGGSPASPELVAAVQQIDVEDHADLADMLRLRIATAVRVDGDDWTVLDGVFSRLANVRLSISVAGGRLEPLIDAYAIDVRAAFSNEPGRSVVEVVGMDGTALMNLEEKVRAWPNMADSAIASTIFGEYGFGAELDDTQPARQDVDYTTMQRGTDIQFLRTVAERNGFECYVEVDPASGRTIGHFHAPRLAQQIQGVLSVNLGPATNVNVLNARHDMLGAATAEATGLQIESQDDQPAQVGQVGLPALGSSPTVSGDRPRRVLLSQTGLSETGELQTYAQAVVDRSSFAVTAEGELNTVSYGRVLRAKRPVLLRGAGSDFSGTYYVERVQHTLSGEGYVQRFRLRRNASGLTRQESFREDDALPAGPARRV